jgi:glycosyltransferase involved in cell wall biosynthesis
MVGPDPEGLGGISRVVKTWSQAGFFDDYEVDYVVSASNSCRNRWMSMVKGLYVYFSRLFRGPDIVYVHTSVSTSYFRKSLYVIMARLFQRKVVLHIHPTRFLDFFAGLTGMTRQYSGFILGQIHGFVVLTEEMRARIASLSRGKTVYLLRNPVDVSSLANRENVERRETALLYLGWYVRGKGIYELVDAISELKRRVKDVHLSFFGTKEIQQLKIYVTNKGLNDCITVNGWIGDEEKIRQLYSSTLLVLPSHSEGIPNVILEAMATKTPIVATPVGGLKEILRDEENALVADVNDPAGLSEKIERLLRDKDLRDRLANNAYREAVNQYDVKVIREHFRKIIDRVTG